MKLNLNCLGRLDSLLIATAHLHINSGSDNSLCISFMATEHVPKKQKST